MPKNKILPELLAIFAVAALLLPGCIPTVLKTTATTKTTSATKFTSTTKSTASTGVYKGGPIVIEDDEQFTKANGVVSGSGTETDPYIIEGWTIDASSWDTGLANSAISIYSTSVPFIIRSCHIEAPIAVSGSYPYGISMSSAENGRVEGCTVRNCYTGISLDGCSNVVISGNTVENCSENGISNEGYLSSEITISNNNVTGCGTGINFHYLENSQATGNTVKNNHDGIEVDDVFDCTISKNIAQENEDSGINVEGTFSNCTANISENDASNNGWSGIGILCSNITISNNTANGNKESGIALDFVGLTDIAGSGCTISHNTANNNGGDGLYIGSGCNGNTISSNTANNNGMNGIEIEDVNNTVSDNSFSSNNILGKYEEDCPKDDWISEYNIQCPIVAGKSKCWECGGPTERIPSNWDILVYWQGNVFKNNTCGTSAIGTSAFRN